MKKLLALLLAMVMILALFAGCSGSDDKDDDKDDKDDKKTSQQSGEKEDEKEAEANIPDQEKLIGTWEGELDMTEAIMQQVGAGAEGLEIEDFSVTAVFTFKEDGTYTMAFDEDSVEDAFDGLVEDLSVFMEDMMKEQAEAAGMTLEQLMEAAGMTMDDLVDMVVQSLEEEDLVDTLVEESKTEGKYEAKDGKLYTTDDPDEDIDEDVYDTYTLEGDVLTLTATYGSDADENLIKSVYPVVLKKVS